MYDKKIKEYHVKIYVETFLNEYHYLRREVFSNIDEAINYGKNQIEKGNRIIIEEISIVTNWEQ